MTEVAITSRAREVREIELGEGSAPHGVIGQLLAHLDRYLGEWLRAPGSGGARQTPQRAGAAVRENDGDDGHRRAGPAAAGSADLGHRSLQLPLRLLHAEGGLRARLPVPRARRAADVRGDR